MEKVKKNQPTKRDLQRKIVELEAQLASTYHFASLSLDKAGHKNGGLAVSAVIVRLTALGGRELINPVAIRGGLSEETIQGLRKDIQRSYDEAVEFKPLVGKDK